jgi:hypothetical protein
MVEQVCGLNDPFCPAANGAKQPDNSGIRSLSYPIHQRYSITTDANGDGGILFVPQYFYNPALVGTFTGTSGVFGPFVAGTRLSGVTAYRIVSWGVKVKRVCAPLTSSGTVYIRGYADKDGANMVTTDTAAYNSDFSSDAALQDCREIAVIGRRTDETSMLFRPIYDSTPTTNLVDWESPGWGPISISVNGGPVSVAVLNVEFFMNMELTFSDAETLGLLMTPSPPYNDILVDAAKKVSSEAKSVFLEGAREAGAYVVNKAAKALATALAMKMGGPRAAQLAIAL